ITINLLQNGVVIETQDVSAEDDWSYSFTELDEYDEEGVAYEYTISEQDVPGYQAETTGYDLTNTRSEQRDITVTKGWLDGNSEERPDSITVTLFQNGEVYETVEITANANWTYVFENLEAFDENGVAFQ